MIDGSRYFWCPVALPLISAAEVLDSSHASHSSPPSAWGIYLPDSPLSPKPQKLTKPTLNDQTYEGTNSPESCPQLISEGSQLINASAFVLGRENSKMDSIWFLGESSVKLSSS